MEPSFAQVVVVHADVDYKCSLFPLVAACLSFLEVKV